MKCIYCGKELDEGDLFCPRCKKAAQIVPDYNVYEDDYLKQVLTDRKRSRRQGMRQFRDWILTEKSSRRKNR